MKLQTVLILLASVVSVHSQSQIEAPFLSGCLDTVANGDATNLQNCQKCIAKVEKECLPAADPEGNKMELLQNLEESDAISCGEDRCIQALDDAENTATKRDVNKRCRGRLCGN